jgi:23S rRNA (uracil1939-C5)-methyltransferase
VVYVGVFYFQCNQFPRTDLNRIIYVGCGFDAVERDTRVLIDSRRWKVNSADGYVLFPGSDHIETVVVFDRIR